jgi:hypothetical protein
VTIHNEVSLLSIKPTGTVRSDFQVLDQVPVGGGSWLIEVFPEYQSELLRIEENSYYSYLWFELWFHKARCDLLTLVPGKVNPSPWEKIGGCLNSAGQLITGDKFPGTDCEQNLQLSLGIEEKSKKPDAPFLWLFRLLPNKRTFLGIEDVFPSTAL